MHAGIVYWYALIEMGLTKSLIAKENRFKFLAIAADGLVLSSLVIAVDLARNTAFANSLVSNNR